MLTFPFAFSMKRLAITMLALLLFVGASPAQLPAPERAKIEALIATVGKLPDAEFVRNGKTYKPATAVKFLRGKWENRADEIRSAEDFIAKVATRSSTTGRPYLVRYNNGREVETAAFFRAELAKLR